MTKSIATGLLITYSVILFGYGLASLGHSALHAVKNPIHSHGSISHEHEAAQGDHQHDLADLYGHDIDDHSLLLEELNEKEQAPATHEVEHLYFTFPFWQPIESISIKTLETISIGHQAFYLCFYKSLKEKPSTPPPLV